MEGGYTMEEVKLDISNLKAILREISRDYRQDSVDLLFRVIGLENDYKILDKRLSDTIHHRFSMLFDKLRKIEEERTTATQKTSE